MIDKDGNVVLALLSLDDLLKYQQESKENLEMWKKVPGQYGETEAKLTAEEVERIEAELARRVSFREGDLVERGCWGDYDTGHVVCVAGDWVTVSWEGGGFQSTLPSRLIRPHS